MQCIRPVFFLYITFFHFAKDALVGPDVELLLQLTWDEDVEL
jgi:hypothetical protein